MDAKNQTAIEWIEMEIARVEELFFIPNIIYRICEEAKEMEKEQIMKAARQCHFEGLRQSAKTSEEYIKYGEQYYNETYKLL